MNEAIYLHTAPDARERESLYRYFRAAWEMTPPMYHRESLANDELAAADGFSYRHYARLLIFGESHMIGTTLRTFSASRHRAN